MEWQDLLNDPSINLENLDDFTEQQVTRYGELYGQSQDERDLTSSYFVAFKESMNNLLALLLACLSRPILFESLKHLSVFGFRLALKPLHNQV